MKCKDCYHFDVCVLKNEKVNFANNVKDLQVDRFKCFKDKSKIIELPCKVGDTLFIIDPENENGSIVKTICTEIKIDAEDMWVCTNYDEFYFDDFGKTVFLTKEEAEQALRENRRTDNEK